VGGDTVTMGQLINTKIAGPPAMMELESTFAKVLASVDGFRVKGHELTLSNNGTVFSTFLSED
jgi:heat shock protein HslJ